LAGSALDAASAFTGGSVAFASVEGSTATARVSKGYRQLPRGTMVSTMTRDEGGRSEAMTEVDGGGRR
jgi:hypothetical protein